MGAAEAVGQARVLQAALAVMSDSGSGKQSLAAAAIAVLQSCLGHESRAVQWGSLSLAAMRLLCSCRQSPSMQVLTWQSGKQKDRIAGLQLLQVLREGCRETGLGPDELARLAPPQLLAVLPSC